MLKFIVLFTGLGFALGHLVPNTKAVFIVFGVIALAWSFVTAPIWGFVTLGELFLGYGAKVIFFDRAN